MCWDCVAHEGDTIVITRIDRLARSMKDLQEIVHELKEKCVLLKATEQPIDTSNSMGKMFFDMLGVFAEFETGIRRERQAEGIAKAKSKGASNLDSYLQRKIVAKTKRRRVVLAATLLAFRTTLYNVITLIQKSIVTD